MTASYPVFKRRLYRICRTAMSRSHASFNCCARPTLRIAGILTLRHWPASSHTITDFCFRNPTDSRFIGATSKSARAGVGKGCRRKYHSRSAFTCFGDLRQRALDTAIAEITKKTDISIEIESLERSKHRQVTSVTFVITEQAVPNR